MTLAAAKRRVSVNLAGLQYPASQVVLLASGGRCGACDRRNPPSAAPVCSSRNMHKAPGARRTLPRLDVATPDLESKISAVAFVCQRQGTLVHGIVQVESSGLAQSLKMRTHGFDGATRLRRCAVDRRGGEEGQTDRSLPSWSAVRCCRQRSYPTELTHRGYVLV